MANMLPVALKALAAYQTVSSISRTLNDQGEKSENLALQQLQAQQQLQQNQSVQDAALKKAELQASAEENARTSRDALKRAVARQRAQFGASGVDMSDGSSEAVLLGLFQETDDELAARERLDTLKAQSIDQNLLQQTSSNTLTLTQAKEREKLNDLDSTLDKVDGIIDAF